MIDLVKDITNISANRNRLKSEIKLNDKLLKDIKDNIAIPNDRRIEIVNMLETEHLWHAVQHPFIYGFPRRKVSEELATKYKASQIQGNNTKELTDKLYLMISFIKKEIRNPRVHLNLRLKNIYKYNRILLELIR